METQWNERLLRASFRRASSWVRENPIKNRLIFGAPAVALQAAIFAGVLQMGDVLLAAVSLIIAPIVLVAIMVMRTLLVMLYEVRDALGSHLNPVVGDAAAQNFSCELANLGANEIALRVTNHGATGNFHAKVVDLTGVENSPVPISVRWRSNDTEATRRINRGDSELLTVVRVRGRRAVDFLQPTSVNKTGYQRVAALNGDTGPKTPTVAARIRVFNQQSEGEGQRTQVLRLVFTNGADTPVVELVSETETEPATAT